jgi:hypothetical protein
VETPSPSPLIYWNHGLAGFFDLTLELQRVAGKILSRRELAS